MRGFLLFAFLFVFGFVVFGQNHQIFLNDSTNASLFIELPVGFEKLIKKRAEEGCITYIPKSSTGGYVSRGVSPVVDARTKNESRSKTTQNNSETIEFLSDPCKVNPRLNGFKIQIYNGNFSEAKVYENQLKQLLPGMNTEIKYVSPEYKVLVGNYLSSGSYKADLRRIKKAFPTAFVIRAKVWCRLAK